MHADSKRLSGSVPIRILSLVERGTVPADKPKRGRRGAPVGAESGPQGQQGDRRRKHLSQRNHEPGPGSEPKSRGTRGGRKPQKSRRLCGANAAAPVLRDSVGQARWVRSASQGHGRSEHRREVVRSDLEGDRGLSTTPTQVDSFVWGGVTRLAGLRGPVGRGAELRGFDSCFSLALGRVRDSEAGVEKALEGTNVQESIGRRSGATSGGANGLGEGVTLRSG